MAGCDFDTGIDNKDKQYNEQSPIFYEPRFFNDEGFTLKIRPISPNDTDAWIICQWA